MSAHTNTQLDLLSEQDRTRRYDRTINTNDYVPLRILAFIYPRYFFDEVTNIISSLVMLQEFVVNDIVIHIMSMYIQIVHDYSYYYFDSIYIKLTMAECSQLGLEFYSNMSHPLLYVYRFVQYLHNTIVRILDNSKWLRESIRNGTKYMFHYVHILVPLGQRNVYRLTELIVRTNSIKVHGYLWLQRDGCESAVLIDSIEYYVSLMKSLIEAS